MSVIQLIISINLPNFTSQVRLILSSTIHSHKMSSSVSKLFMRKMLKQLPNLKRKQEAIVVKHRKEEKVLIKPRVKIRHQPFQTLILASPK